ncbi:hypothetical protein LEMLEM_LOCUS6436 [Lemmus lemmus]
MRVSCVWFQSLHGVLVSPLPYPPTAQHQSAPPSFLFRK